MKTFVITGYPRTGSNHLILMLRSHPHILCDAEIFNRDHDLSNVHDPVAHMEKIRGNWEARTKKENVSHFGFKLFADHALYPPFSDIWKYIQEQELPVILLTRRNLLNRYLSEMLALAHLSPTCNSWDNLLFYKPINIDPQKCFYDIHGHMDYEAKLEETFSNNPLFHMAYEDLQPTPESYGKLLDFLGLEWQRPIVRLYKQRIKTQRQMILNYKELKATFAPSFAHFFDEEEVPLL